MMVLVALESLQIRALHSQSAQSLSLRAAVLEGAENLLAGHHANNVEICLCPGNYLGDSCQQCAPGYYRDTKGLFLGKCVPCHCNSHSDQCLDGSGICVNCRHNTAGNHCEKCQGGFHGNNTVDGHAVSCSSCPCPLQVASNNFAIQCVEKRNHMQCVCMPGYAGSNCERCAPGYYGNPMVIGSTCQPCNCNGNSDPNALFSDCHPLTGECQSCMHNSAGPHCEICAPGFYGDAITAKNCTRCNCSPCGTAYCGPHTEQCHCKPGVVGAYCDRCDDGAFGFDLCTGCRKCDCDAAAALVQQCNPVNGSCSCRPGVNGPNCHQCAPGYWDYSPNGCKKCECKGGRCDPRTGECRCPEGLTGKQCDTCINKHSVLVQHGTDVYCQPCDSCVLVLLDDLDKLNQLYQSVAQQLTSLNAISVAWAQLSQLNASLENISNAIANYNSTLDESRNRADMLEEELQTIDYDIKELEEKASVTQNKGFDLENNTNSTYTKAQDLFGFIKGIMGDVHGIIKRVNQTLQNETNVISEKELIRKIAEVESMLRDMRFRDFDIQRRLAGNELDQANKLVDRVENEITNRTLNNEAVAENIRNKLNQLNQQLMDLRDALIEAVNNTAHTVEANNINQKRLEEVQKQINDLREKYKEVENLMQMAEDDVTQVNGMLSMLQDSKEEYERLAAQLDGARQLLVDKVQKYAPSATKIPLVEKAERHAEMLDQLAKNLTSLISGSSQGSFIQRALNASRAYTNIINSVQEAETAAKRANESATETLENIKDKDLPQKAVALKIGSIELVKKGKELNNQSQSLKPRLDSIKKSLESATEKKENLINDLKNIQKNLNFSREDIENDIAAAKSAAEQANNTVTTVSNTLAPIQKQLEEWQKQYGDSNTTTDDINKALSDANTSVTALSDTLPQLIKKLDRLQNTSFQPSNISDSIQRIRLLIEQARNAANKVSVSMQFNGTSGVQVRTPSNVADLAAYSSLQMYIKLPRITRRRRQTATAKPQFVFYLGNKDSTKDYMAMTLEGKRLHWYFNVGGETAQVLIEEDVQKDYFNKLVLERTLQYGQTAMSTDLDGTKIVKQSMEAGGNKGLLNLPAEDTVFYVGGYSSTFKPPVDLNMSTANFFTGCIELLSLNEELISLYNFEETYQMNTTSDLPCSRQRPTNTPEWVVDGVYFDGSGYVEVLFDARTDDRLFEQQVKLISQNGIIMLFHRGDKYLCVAMFEGFLKLFHNVEGTLTYQPASENLLKISNAQPQNMDVIFQLGKNEMQVRIRRQKLFTITSKELNFTGSYFLGGVPEDQMPESLKTIFPKRGSIKGCMRQIKALRSFVQLKTMKSSGISYGCPDNLLFTREAHFAGEGYLRLTLTDVPDVPDNFYAGIGFRTDQQNGLMFYHQGQSDVCQVILDSGHVVVSAGKNEVRSQKSYNDENSHYVAFYSNTDGLQIYIDDVLESGGVRSSAISRAALQSGVTYMGGIPEIKNLTTLTGCLSNFFIKRIKEPQTVEDLKKADDGSKYTFKCPGSSEPLEILDSPRRKNPKKPLGSSRSRMARESCQGEMAVQEVDAYHFSGSSHSQLRFDTLPQEFSNAPHISLSVRLNSTNGLIFHVAGGKSLRTMTLLVSDGHLVLLVNGGKRKASIRSKKKNKDGLWHTIFVKVEGDRAFLTVDGIETQNKKVTGGGKSVFGAPLYIGGLPSDHIAAMPGFIGCVRDLKLNEEVLQSPSHSVGVVPCFQQLVQPGVYFATQGGYLIIDQSLALGRDLEIQLEVRPVSDSGLLLHAGAKKNQQLSLYLNQGQVTVLVNSGSGEFSVSLTPEESLCDGSWHSLAIVKKSNVIQLHVDAASEHGVGPKVSRSNGGKETVYLGSMPDAMEVPGLPSGLPSFNGCVRKGILNHRSVTLSKPFLVSGAVGTQGCPAS